MDDINSTSRENNLAQNISNSLQCTVRTSRQRLCNKWVGCLLCNVVRIYERDAQGAHFLSLVVVRIAIQLK